MPKLPLPSSTSSPPPFPLSTSLRSATTTPPPPTSSTITSTTGSTSSPSAYPTPLPPLSLGPLPLRFELPSARSLIAYNPLTCQFRVLPHLNSALSRHRPVLAGLYFSIQINPTSKSQWLKFSSNISANP